jgi:HK97 family phage major capsid protein
VDQYDTEAAELRKQLTDLATELRDKEDIPADRVTAIEEEITAKSARLDNIETARHAAGTEAKLVELEDRLKAFSRQASQAKAAAILQGAQPKDREPLKVGRYSDTNFLSALWESRRGDRDAQDFIKAVLGTSDATGAALIPNNFVAQLVPAIALANPYRSVFEVVSGITGAGVDIPYETTAITAAILQGAYGSNKDVRDFALGTATATLYTIAQIADIGNQLLRQSNGAAESMARRRLASSLGRTEAQFINNGSGSSQPLGFFPALAAFGQVAEFITTLNSESRAAAIGRGIGAMESRGILADRTQLVIVMNPTDFWELSTETLGTSGSGGWVLDPAEGAASNPPLASLWGVRVIRDPTWPAAQAGTALIIDRSEVQMFLGDEYRIDVSDSAGTRWDQNITGFRAEEEFGFNAEPYVRTGRVQRVNGL